jgi:hypothetical protein
MLVNTICPAEKCSVAFCFVAQFLFAEPVAVQAARCCNVQALGTGTATYLTV